MIIQKKLEYEGEGTVYKFFSLHPGLVVPPLAVCGEKGEEEKAWTIIARENASK